MRTLEIEFALLSTTAGFAFFACSTQAPEGHSTGSGGTGSTSTSSSSNSSSGGPAQCDHIPYTNPPIPEADECVRQNCCPELLTCQKASPFCPWLCAAADPYAIGCDTVWDPAIALRQCSHTQCLCPSGHSEQCDGGADGNSSTSSGSGGPSSSGSG